MIACRDVVVRRRRRNVLDRVTTNVDSGELVAIVGPNGAGKTTLLHVLAGDLIPDEGEVTLAGQSLNRWRPVERARHRAVLPQQNTLSSSFTVRDVVSMGRVPWAGTDRAENDEVAIDEALVTLELTDLADRVATTLSGGEWARTCLARVLAQDANVLLLDEPTASLDVRHQQRLLSIAHQRARNGCAVVAVLHDLNAAAVADRIVLLADGRVAVEGTPEEVLVADVIGDAFGCEVDVIEDPHTGMPLVVPRRVEVRTSVGGRSAL